MSNTTCPSCKHPVPEDALFCPFCGEAFPRRNEFTCPNCGAIYPSTVPALCRTCGFSFSQSKSAPQGFESFFETPSFPARPPEKNPHDIGQKRAQNQTVSNIYLTTAIVLGVLILISVLVIGGVVFWQMNSGKNNFTLQPAPLSTFTPAVQITQTVTAFPTITEIFTPTLVDLPLFTSTATPTEVPFIDPTYQPTLMTDTPTAFVQPSSCPGAAPQRVSIGDTVLVCTKRDRLVVKVDPGLATEEIIRVYPGSELTIVGGPECADDSSWWLVEVPVNTKAAKHQTELSDFFYTDREYTGWVPEGSDAVDPYYLCEQ